MGKLWMLMLYIALAHDEVPYSVSDLRKFARCCSVNAKACTSIRLEAAH